MLKCAFLEDIYYNQDCLLSFEPQINSIPALVVRVLPKTHHSLQKSIGVKACEGPVRRRKPELLHFPAITSPWH